MERHQRNNAANGKIMNYMYQPRVKAAIEKSFRLSVANETMEDRKLAVKWEIRNSKALVLKEKTVAIKVPALTSMWLDKVDVPDIDLDGQYLSYHLLEGETLVSEGTVIFSLPKFFHWADPKLSCKVNGDTITVKAEAYARSVEILNRNQDLVLSDNYFDMDGGVRQVKILSGKPVGIKLRSVYDIR
jgi:beta-mannosidase